MDSPSVRMGKEYINNANAIVDLIHNGFFPSGTVFISSKRDLTRNKQMNESDEDAIIRRCSFTAVKKTSPVSMSFENMVDVLDSETIQELSQMLEKRYLRQRTYAIMRALADEEEGE